MSTPTPTNEQLSITRTNISSPHLPSPPSTHESKSLAFLIQTFIPQEIYDQIYDLTILNLDAIDTDTANKTKIVHITKTYLPPWQLTSLSTRRTRHEFAQLFYTEANFLLPNIHYQSPAITSPINSRNSRARNNPRESRNKNQITPLAHKWLQSLPPSHRAMYCSRPQGFIFQALPHAYLSVIPRARLWIQGLEREEIELVKKVFLMRCMGKNVEIERERARGVLRAAKKKVVVSGGREGKRGFKTGVLKVAILKRKGVENGGVVRRWMWERERVVEGVSE
ncbi:hypothetical protein SMMN14_06971 [Sphaerulina musiva]